jgi:hypothetical protein
VIRSPSTESLDSPCTFAHEPKNEKMGGEERKEQRMEEGKEERKEESKEQRKEESKEGVKASNICESTTKRTKYVRACRSKSVL